MQAMLLSQTMPVERSPLALKDVAVPEPGVGMIRVKVRTCGVCRADLCIAEGQMGCKGYPVIPGHEIVGEVDRCGAGAQRFAPGTLVGIGWLRSACGRCKHCQEGNENLCRKARFTGYDEHGGYSEYAIIREDFAYLLPRGFDAVTAAPLLASGIVGYRAMKLANIHPGDRVGFYGYGSSAHLCLQLAQHWNCSCYVMTRHKSHQKMAVEMGAEWSGPMTERPKQPLDAAIVFAPCGQAVQLALEALDAGGTCVAASVCMSALPSLVYGADLFRERKLTSVCAHTRQDGEEYLRLAAAIPIKPRITTFKLGEANRALLQMKQGELSGSAVLVVNND